MADASASAILLIDDNAVQAATRQTILKRAGFYVIAVLNPSVPSSSSSSATTSLPISASSSQTTSCPA